MSKIIDRAGKGAAISAAENDANLDSLHGINVAVAGTTYTVTVADQGNTLEFTSASAVAVTLTSIATIIGNADTSDFKVTLIATGAGTVTITPNGLNTINNGDATIVLTTDEYATIQTDSTALIWNIINGLGDASTLDGFDSSELVQIANAQTVTGAKTFTADMLLQKATPSLILDASTGDAAIYIKDGTVNRFFIYNDNTSDVTVLRQFDRASPATSRAEIQLTELGKVNIGVGDLQIAGVDLYAIVPRLAVENVFVQNQEIKKNSPVLYLDSDNVTSSVIVFQSGDTDRALIGSDHITDQFILRQYDTDGSTIRVQVLLTELGKFNVAIGGLQIAGIDVDSIFARLAVANVFTADQTITKSGARFYINASSANARLTFQENSVQRADILWDSTSDIFSLWALDDIGTTVAARINLTDAGKVDISIGDLQIAGIDVDSIFARLDSANTFTQDQTIQKAGAELILDGLTGDSSVLFTNAGGDRARLYYQDALDAVFLRQYLPASGVAAAEIRLTAAGKVNVVAGTLQLAGVDVTATAAELSILDGVTSTAAELNILDGVTSTAAELNYADGPNAASKFLLLDGSAQTPFANKAAFRGALVHLSADESLSNNTWTHISWDSETSGYDTDSIHDTVTNNQRLTVPAGVTRIRLNAQVIIQNDGAGTGNRQAVFSKNDETTNPAHFIGCGGRYLSAATTGITSFNFSSAVITVIAGDYFTVAAYQNSGGALNIESQITDVSGGSWVSMEIIE